MVRILMQKLQPTKYLYTNINILLSYKKEDLSRITCKYSNPKLGYLQHLICLNYNMVIGGLIPLQAFKWVFMVMVLFLHKIKIDIILFNVQPFLLYTLCVCH